MKKTNGGQKEILGMLLGKIMSDVKNGSFDALKVIDDEEEDEGIPIGRVSSDLMKRYNKLTRQRENLDDEIALRKQFHLIEIKRKMAEEFDDKNEALRKAHNEIWAEITKVVGADDNDNLSIRPSDGTVMRHGSIVPPDLRVVDFKKNEEEEKPVH